MVFGNGPLEEWFYDTQYGVPRCRSLFPNRYNQHCVSKLLRSIRNLGFTIGSICSKIRPYPRAVPHFRSVDLT